MKFIKYYIFGFDTETILTKNEISEYKNYCIYFQEEKEHKFYSFQIYGIINNREIKLISYDIEEFTKLHKKLGLKKWQKNIKLPIVLVSHNAEFDVSTIIKALDEKEINYNVKIRYNKSNFLKASFYFSNSKSPDVIILDLQNFTGRKTLYEIAEEFGLKKLKKPSFLGIRKWKNEKEKQIFENYAINDAKLCYLIFTKILNTAQKYAKIKSLPLSASSLSYKLFISKNKLPKYDNKWDYIVFQLFKGGRSECYYRGMIDYNNFGKIYHYDFNSLYPFVMFKFNYPSEFKYSSNDVNLDYEGFAICEIEIDHNYIGILGIHKQIDGYKKLIFPNGKIRGQFLINELRFLEEYGLGKIVKVIRAYHFEPIESPFKEFIKYFYELRKQKEFKYIAKLIMNSLYGKLGTRLYNVYVEKLNNNIKPQDLVGKIIDWDNSPNLARKIIELNKYVGYNPLIASYITAYGRLILTKLLLDIYDKGKEIFYCDTDSVITNAKLNTSDELGKLKLENEYKKVILIRSKSYIAYSENQEIIKLKGIPKSAEIKTLNEYMKEKQQSNYYIVENVEKNDLVAIYDKILDIREALHRNKKVLQVINEKRTIDISDDKKRIYEKEFKDFEKLTKDFCNSKPLKF